MNVATTSTLTPQDAQQRLSSQPLRLLNADAARVLVNRATGNADVERELRSECQFALAAAEPARASEIAVMLHRLSLHYPDRKLTEKEAQFVTEDWLEDLDGVPNDLIETAFRKWRKSAKCAFFPKAGEILELVKAEIAMRKFLAKRAGEVLSGLRGEDDYDRERQECIKAFRMSGIWHDTWGDRPSQSELEQSA